MGLLGGLGSLLGGLLGAGSSTPTNPTTTTTNQQGNNGNTGTTTPVVETPVTPPVTQVPPETGQQGIIIETILTGENSVGSGGPPPGGVDDPDTGASTGAVVVPPQADGGLDLEESSAENTTPPTVVTPPEAEDSGAAGSVVVTPPANTGTTQVTTSEVAVTDKNTSSVIQEPLPLDEDQARAMAEARTAAFRHEQVMASIEESASGERTNDIVSMMEANKPQDKEESASLQDKLAQTKAVNPQQGAYSNLALSTVSPAQANTPVRVQLYF